MQYERIPDLSEAPFNHYLMATRASWAVNWLLLFVKLYVVIISNSKAVVAALMDSAVLSTAEMRVKIHDDNYPIGRSRLEALGVLGSAAVMIMASFEVVQYSVVELFQGYFYDDTTELNFNWVMLAIMGGATLLKLLLYIYCTFANKNLPVPMDSMDALAEDHINDVMSNAVALVTGLIAFWYKNWWIDPSGAILISAIIIYRWYDIILDQVKKIVGHTAPQDFIDSMSALASSHDTRIEVDVIRAYHYGAAFNVEMEIILPADMSVRESHDIALALQHRIEEFDNVERAFVHVDYAKRDGLEHKVERGLYFNLHSHSYSNSSGTLNLSPEKPTHKHTTNRLCLDPDHIPEGVWGSV